MTSISTGDPFPENSRNDTYSTRYLVVVTVVDPRTISTSWSRDGSGRLSLRRKNVRGAIKDTRNLNSLRPILYRKKPVIFFSTSPRYSSTTIMVEWRSCLRGEPEPFWHRYESYRRKSRLLLPQPDLLEIRDGSVRKEDTRLSPIRTSRLLVSRRTTHFVRD